MSFGPLKDLALFLRAGHEDVKDDGAADRPEDTADPAGDRQSHGVRAEEALGDYVGSLHRARDHDAPGEAAQGQRAVGKALGYVVGLEYRQGDGVAEQQSHRGYDAAQAQYAGDEVNDEQGQKLLQPRLERVSQDAFLEPHGHSHSRAALAVYPGHDRAEEEYQPVAAGKARALLRVHRQRIDYGRARDDDDEEGADARGDKRGEILE